MPDLWHRFDQKIRKRRFIMPLGDRTGPLGAGVKSGRVAGFCAGYGMPGFANPSMSGNPGRPRRRNQNRWCLQPTGWGRRSRWGFAAGRAGGEAFSGYPAVPQPVDPEWEKEALSNRSQALQAELEAINKRLNEMARQEKAP
jgi:hypothetical protein